MIGEESPSNLVLKPRIPSHEEWQKDASENWATGALGADDQVPATSAPEPADRQLPRGDGADVED